MTKLDEFDLAILRLLQQSVRLKTEAIADEVGLSATAVQRRIKRLREDGVIAREVAVLDPKAMGGRITAAVGVVLAAESPANLDTFKRHVRAAPEVQQCYWVTGAYDFFLIVVFEDMSDYEALTQRLFIGNAGVKRFDTFVGMETVKQGLELPL